ncbi:TPA: ribose-phosphate diphosphokinase [Candidatus Woesearchaeota archaeon]|nr:ribose-phosphate diphosphokinase [Candidatus Woesearchaeota archaeon]
MIITTCGNSLTLTKRLAKALNVPFSPLTVSAFPDGEVYIKFNTTLKDKIIVIVESFQPHPDQSLLRTIFAAETARDLGAKRIILIAPYLAYLRQDARFHPGEAISSKIVGKLLSSCVDKIITFDPHLHRYRSLNAVFSIPSTVLTANDLIVNYIKKKYPKAVLVGPDWESSQWAERIAKKVGTESTIFEKKRYSSRKVRVEMIKPISLKNKQVLIVDDIISTGHTLIEAAKKAYREGAKKVIAVGIHGIFAENAWTKLKKANITKIVTTNCIAHPTNTIDIVPLLTKELQKEKRR